MSSKVFKSFLNKQLFQKRCNTINLLHGSQHTMKFTQSSNSGKSKMDSQTSAYLGLKHKKKKKKHYISIFNYGLYLKYE